MSLRRRTAVWQANGISDLRRAFVEREMLQESTAEGHSMSTKVGQAARLGLLALSLLASSTSDAGARDAERDCLALPSESDVGKALRGIQFSAETQSRPLRDIRITGLRTISENELWRLYGGKPSNPTAENAAALLRHITR